MKKIANVEFTIAAVLINIPLVAILAALLLQSVGINALEWVVSQNQQWVVAIGATLILTGFAMGFHVVILDASGKLAQEEKNGAGNSH